MGENSSSPRSPELTKSVPRDQQFSFAFSAPPPVDCTVKIPVAAHSRRKQLPKLADKQPIGSAMFNDLLNKGQAPTVTTAAELRQLLRDRVAELGITYATVDQLAGFPDRYVSRLLCEPPARNITIPTLITLLETLALKFTSDDVTLGKLRRRRDWVRRRREGPQYLPRRDLGNAVDSLPINARHSGRPNTERTSGHG